MINQSKADETADFKGFKGLPVDPGNYTGNGTGAKYSNLKDKTGKPGNVTTLLDHVVIYEDNGDPESASKGVETKTTTIKNEKKEKSCLTVMGNQGYCCRDFVNA